MCKYAIFADVLARHSATRKKNTRAKASSSRPCSHELHPYCAFVSTDSDFGLRLTESKVGQGSIETSHSGPYSTDQEWVFAEPDKRPQTIVPCILAL